MTVPNNNQYEVEETLSQMPAYFVPNVGQKDDHRIHYYSKGIECEAHFTSEEAILLIFKTSSRKEKSFSKQGAEKEVQGVRLDFRFLGANPKVKPEGKQPSSGKINYLKGNDPTAWKTTVSTFQEVVYPELWPGINLVFKIKKKSLKYEFIVQPGAKVEDIRFTYAGAKKFSIDKKGNLVIQTALGEMLDERPVSYQKKNDLQVPISSSFHLQPDDKEGYMIGFEVEDNYDSNYPLIIDPGLIYSTYLGGSDSDQGSAIAVDAGGNAYVTGFTFSADFPTTAGAFDTTYNDNVDAFVAKVGTVLTPSITCTTNITVSNNRGLCGAIVHYPNPTVTDECPLGFTVSCTPASGSFFPAGTTTVTCTVIDPCGGIATCAFTVTVIDTKPFIICCCDCCCTCDCRCECCCGCNCCCDCDDD